MWVAGRVISRRTYVRRLSKDRQKAWENLAPEDREPELADLLRTDYMNETSYEQVKALEKETQETHVVHLAEAGVYMGDNDLVLAQVAIQIDKILGWTTGGLPPGD
jgi:hypothetical protein